MEPTSDTDMYYTGFDPDLSPPETQPTPRRIVSFYPTSAGSSALWPDDLPTGTDVLTYPQGGSSQQLGCVTGLHAWIIEARSPLIAAAFESSVSGKRLHLDSLDCGTVLPFLRFLYTGYYASYGDWEDVPTSVWLHCRMYYLGHLYDLADLKSQAYVNVLRQCEFGCSSPNMPIDLCPAIDFVYRHLSGHDAISDALVQYCVTRCLSHKLHEDAEFKNVAFFVRAFHQDLTKACRDRGYEDESAATIIQLPYMHYAPATYASTEHPPISRFEDIIHHYHSTDRFDEVSPKKRQRVTFDERRACPTEALEPRDSTKQPVPENQVLDHLERRSTREDEERLSDVHTSLPLRPALETQIPATPSSHWTRKMIVKLPTRPRFTSSANMLDTVILPKDENMPIWRRRDIKGTNSSLSQALKMVRNQERQPEGNQSLQAMTSQEQNDWAVNQPTERSKHRKGSEAEHDSTGQSLQSMQSVNIPCGGVVQDRPAQPTQKIPSARSTEDNPINVFPEATTTPAFVAPNAPATATCISVRPQAGSRALQDYQMQLMLLEQQNKKRLLMARQYQDSMTDPCSSSTDTSDEMQSAVPAGISMLSNKGSGKHCPTTIHNPRNVRDRKFSASTNATGAIESADEPNTLRRTCTSNPSPVPDSPNSALLDPRMRLMLLEQQNKKRVLMARAEQESFCKGTDTNTLTSAGNVPPVPHSGEIHRFDTSNLKMQQMLLEQQNKRTLLMEQLGGGERVEHEELSERALSLSTDACSASANGSAVSTSAAIGEATSATPQPIAIAPTFACGEDNDILDKFDFDKFLASDDPSILEGSAFHSGPDPDIDSDSDAQSWVNVALESPKSGSSPVATVTTTAAVPASTNSKRSRSDSDSEWDFC